MREQKMSMESHVRPRPRRASKLTEPTKPTKLSHENDYSQCDDHDDLWVDVDVAVRSDEGDERGEGVGREDPSGLAEVEEELRCVKR